MGWEQWLSIAAASMALAALVLALAAWRIARRPVVSVSAVAEPVDVELVQAPGPAAVVFNPSKGVDGDRLRDLVTQVSAEVGLASPLWFETTVEDPGVGQAHQALRQGASVVVAAGGDGTVRAVASAMAGTGVPMALLPLGTGNLLARNLDLPLGDDRETIAVALTGATRAIDIGWMRTELRPGEAGGSSERRPADGDAEGSSEPAVPAAAAADPQVDTHEEHAFLVIGGLGFDAEMVRDTDETLKARIGWIAYFIAAARHLVGPKLHASVQLGESGASATFTARTILIANCGRLPGGVVLFPDARVDDGWLDIAAIDTRGGLIGWADLLRRVILQGLGIRRVPSLYQTGTIDFRRSRSVTIQVTEAAQVQVDGDLLGTAHVVHARIDADGLLVRTA